MLSSPHATDLAVTLGRTADARHECAIVRDDAHVHRPVRSAAGYSDGGRTSGGRPAPSVGIATFTASPGSSLVFGIWSEEISGYDLAVSGSENYNIAVTLAGGVYSFGFDVHEPSYQGTAPAPLGCNAACFDTTFAIEVFSGVTSLGSFNYNAPNDPSGAVGGPLGFFGIHSSTAFDRIVVRDSTDTNDNGRKGTLPFKG